MKSFQLKKVSFLFETTILAIQAPMHLESEKQTRKTDEKTSPVPPDVFTPIDSNWFQSAQ